jgi:hypothetical protein
MVRKCEICSADFETLAGELEFLDKLSPVISGTDSAPARQGMASASQKLQLPKPTECPDCRQMKRLARRNERALYLRKCDLSGKQIVSIYSSDSPYKVYANDIWWSDQWGPKEYSQEIDFNKSFFEQFYQLQLKVPRLNLYQKNVENSLFTNHTENLRNSYLSVSATGEAVLYSKWMIDCKDCIDSYQLEKSELCYESLYSVGAYNCKFIFLSDYCRDSSFLYDCKNCSDCFMSANLRNKQYCIENVQYSREEYFEKMSKINLKSAVEVERLKVRFQNMLSERAIFCETVQINSEECSGDFLYNCKNVQASFDVIESRDCLYCFDAGHSLDCMDTYEQAFDCELQFNSHACNRGTRLIACSVCYDVDSCLYSDSCHNSSNLFGCIGLRRAEYCIFNKQYSREEYFELLPKVIELMRRFNEWGKFFPVSISPFAYNETVAQEYFPLNSKLAAKKGYAWTDQLGHEKYLGHAVELPDNIEDIDQSYARKILKCKTSGELYRLTDLELELYKKMGVAAPKKCPNQRHLERMNLRNKRKFFQDKCSKCGIEISVTAKPGKYANIFCKKCYLVFVL